MADPAAALKLYAIAVTGVLKDGTRPFLVGAELAADKKAAARSALVEVTKYRPQYTGQWQEGPNVTVRQVPHKLVAEAMAEYNRHSGNGFENVEVLPAGSIDPEAIANLPIVVPESSVD